MKAKARRYIFLVRTYFAMFTHTTLRFTLLWRNLYYTVFIAENSDPFVVAFQHLTYGVLIHTLNCKLFIYQTIHFIFFWKTTDWLVFALQFCLFNNHRAFVLRTLLETWRISTAWNEQTNVCSIDMCCWIAGDRYQRDLFL